MKTLFVTDLPNLSIEERERGFQFASSLFVTSDGQYVRSFLTDAFRLLAGHLAVEGLLQSKAIAYSLQKLDLGPDPLTTATHYIDAALRAVNSFSMALWLMKDNAVDSSEGYLQYDTPTHPDRVNVSNHNLGIFYWDAVGQRNPVSFSKEELREARSLMSVFGRLGLPKGPVPTAPTLPPKVPRLGRVWYFLENARATQDVAVKIATYVTCLEALYSTDSTELAHKLSERLALFISSSPGEQQSIYERAKRAYGVRSKTLHGDELGSNQRNALLEVARDCDEFVRRSLLKALSSDEEAAIFNGTKDDLEKHMLRLIFRDPSGVSTTEEH